MHYTFRDKTLHLAMKQVSETLGSTATVVSTSEIRVPHHAKPVGFEVIASGEFRGQVNDSSSIPGIPDHQPNQSASDELENSLQDHELPEGWNPSDCVDEIMTRLFDAVNELQGFRKIRSKWVETRSLLQEAQVEIRSLTERWENRIEQQEDIRPTTEDKIENLWERSERTVAAFIGPSSAGKTTTVLKIAERAQEAGVPTGLIQWNTCESHDYQVDEITLTDSQIPLRRATTKQEVMKAIFELSAYELVLIDTEAHSPWNEEEVDHVFEALNGPGIEFHLVIPSTWDKGDILDACESYDYRIEGLVLTHLEKRTDESFFSEINNLVHLNNNLGLTRDQIQSAPEIHTELAVSTRQNSPQPGNICPPEKREEKKSHDFDYLRF